MPENIAIRNCTFSFKCESKWENLEKMDYEDVRFCNVCQKEIYFCHTDDDLVRNIHLNRCVAVDRYSIIEMGYFAPEKFK